jgi:hypothetical protein
MRNRLSIVLAVLLTAAACSSEQPPPAPVEVQTACADVFGGAVCTWERMNGAELMEVGATIPIASIENAPANAPMAWPPASVASLDLGATTRQQTGVVQLTVNWEAGGHPPVAFLNPHVDFHFYAIPAAEMNAIDCVDTTKPATLPAGYGLPDIQLPPEMAGMIGVSTLVGLCVPKMGMHAIVQSDLDRTDAFDGTLVVGYDRGTPIFVGPMISKAMLMRKASFDLPMPVVPGYAKSLPTRFRAEFDADSASYRFILSEFAH